MLIQLASSRFSVCSLPLPLSSLHRSISNLLRGKPQPEWDAVRSALPTLKMLMDSADEEVIIDAAWSALHSEPHKLAATRTADSAVIGIHFSHSHVSCVLLL